MGKLASLFRAPSTNYSTHLLLPVHLVLPSKFSYSRTPALGVSYRLCMSFKLLPVAHAKQA